MINKVLFIGAGVMAEGIIKEIIKEEKLKPENIMVNNRTTLRMEYLSNIYGVNSCYNLRQGIEEADVMFICVKPQDVNDVLEVIKTCNNRESLVVSIAAGKTIASIEDMLGKERKIIRVMPNSMVDVKIGYSALCSKDNVEDSEMNFVEDLIKSIGDTIWIKEMLFDTFTVLSCSAPALVYEFIEAIVDAGVYNGISRGDAINFTLQNLIGSCEMIKTTRNHSTVLKEKMTSPGGTTITALKTLNEAGFKGIIQNAITNGIKRTKEL